MTDLELRYIIKQLADGKTVKVKGKGNLAFLQDKIVGLSLPVTVVGRDPAELSTREPEAFARLARHWKLL